MLPLPKLVWATAFVSLAASLLYELTAAGLIAAIGPFNLQVYEIVLVLGAASALLSFPRGSNRGMSFVSIAALGLAALYGIDALRGIALNPGIALNTSRVIAPIAIWLVLAVRLRGDNYDLAPLMRVTTIFALMVAALVLARTVLGPQFLYFAPYDSPDKIFDNGRVASSTGALLIGTALLFWVGGYRFAGWAGSLVISGVLALALLLTKQATAVIAVVAAFGLTWALNPRRVKNVGLLALIAFGSLVPVLFFYGSDIVQALPKAIVGDATQRGNTFDWRKGIWDQFKAGFFDDSFINQAIGLPSGVHERIVLTQGEDSVIWENSLHSHYLGALQNSGIFGLTLYLLILLAVAFGAFLASLAGAGRSWRNPAIAAGLVVSLAIFSITYELRAENAMMLAIAICLATRYRQAGRARAQQPLPASSGLNVQYRGEDDQPISVARR